MVNLFFSTIMPLIPVEVGRNILPKIDLQGKIGVDSTRQMSTQFQSSTPESTLEIDSSNSEQKFDQSHLNIQALKKSNFEVKARLEVNEEKKKRNRKKV